MSEDPPPYDRTFNDGTWSAKWGIYTDEADPILISIESPDGPDPWAATTVSLTEKRAYMLKQALERALDELREARAGTSASAFEWRTYDKKRARPVIGTDDLRALAKLAQSAVKYGTKVQSEVERHLGKNGAKGRGRKSKK